MTGFTPYSALPTAKIPEAYSRSIPDPIWRVLAGPGTGHKYLVEIHPYNSKLESEFVALPAPLSFLPFGIPRGKRFGGEDVVRLSDHHFITEPDDEATNVYYSPVVDNPLSYDMSLIQGNEISVNSPTFGSIEIANGDEALDAIVGLNFNGRRIVVKAGYAGFRYDEYATVFDGLVKSIEYDDLGITLTISDKGLRLDMDINSPQYGGTGGIDGNSDLVGVMKPLAFGKCFNIAPVLVDPVRLIYQAHAWSMQAVDAVYDAGVALTASGDYADITLAAPGSGEFATCLAKGLIKLGSTPAGRITADVRGDNQGGYAASASQICVRMATELYDTLSFPMDEIDTVGWSKIHEANPGESGIYITAKRTMRQLLDSLLNPCLCYWYFTRFGLLSADQIDTGGIAQTAIAADEIDGSGLKMSDYIAPAWRISVGYAPAWTVQNEDELAGYTSDLRRTFVGNQYRMVTYENRAVRTANSKPLERTFYTNVADKASAEALLERFVRVYGKERRIYQGIAYNGLFRIALGDVVDVNYPRYAIAGAMVVVGIGEDSSTGQTTLDLWG